MNPVKYTTSLFFTLTILLSGCNKDNLRPVRESAFSRDVHLNTLSVLNEVDGGFILAGINDSKVTISKLDASFNTIWEKNNYEWGTLFSEGGWGGAFYSVNVKNIIRDDQGNYNCFCALEEGGDVVWSTILIVKLDKFGNEIKRVKLENTALINVAETYDKGYLLFANKLIKINSDLSTVWENDNQNFIFTGASVTTTNDKGLATTGTWNSEQVLLQKFDENGIPEWTKSNFNQKPFNDLGFDLHQIADGGYLIVGRSRSSITPFDMNCMLIRTDVLGDTIWTKKFGDKTDEWLDQIVLATNNYFIVKENVGYPGDAIQKTIMLKINSDGVITGSADSENYEKLIFTTFGYFTKAVKTDANTIRLSIMQVSDLF